jgi:SAM-dependent methyltransferase
MPSGAAASADRTPPTASADRSAPVVSADRTAPADDTIGTQDAAYAERLARLGGARWKQALNVQAPYRWNLRRLGLGDTLDVGCGIGRNLVALSLGSLGVDHNPHSVEIARQRGLTAYEPAEFHALAAQRYRRHFDSLLLAHVIEHLTPESAGTLLAEYLPYLRPGATLALICPQEAGYRSDPTHVTFTDFDQMRAFAGRFGAHVTRELSFPFPRPVGRVFRYNEFVLLARLPD